MSPLGIDAFELININSMTQKSLTTGRDNNDSTLLKSSADYKYWSAHHELPVCWRLQFLKNVINQKRHNKQFTGDSIPRLIYQMV